MGPWKERHLDWNPAFPSTHSVTLGSSLLPSAPQCPALYMVTVKPTSGTAEIEGDTRHRCPKVPGTGLGPETLNELQFSSSLMSPLAIFPHVPSSPSSSAGAPPPAGSPPGLRTHDLLPGSSNLCTIYPFLPSFTRHPLVAPQCQAPCWVLRAQRLLRHCHHLPKVGRGREMKHDTKD